MNRILFSRELTAMNLWWGKELLGQGRCVGGGADACGTKQSHLERHKRAVNQLDGREESVHKNIEAQIGWA